MDIFDSHTHINDLAFANDLSDVIERAQAFSVTSMLVLAGDHASLRRLQALFTLTPQIYGAAGCHPEDAKRYDDIEEQRLKQALQASRMKALGEIGLDYHCQVSHLVQQQVFRRQLVLARQLHLPVSIHNRDAFADTYQLLKAAQIAEFGGVMHSFNGDEKWAQKFLDLGMYLSFSGVVTFKNAAVVRKAFLATPLERVLVETDAPYLAPEPYRGRQNEPGFTRLTLEYLANLRQISARELAAITYQNTIKFLRIKS